jgi:FkbM family methyltransferase
MVWYSFAYAIVGVKWDTELQGAISKQALNMRFLYNLYRRYIQAPNHPAKLRLIRWIGSRLFPVEGYVYTVSRGIKLLLHPNDWIEYLLLKEGEYEPLTLNFIEKNLKKGQTSLFAGVNFGLHLIVASRCSADTGCVIGVEPQPKALYRAYSNIILNDLFPNIRLVSSALGEQATLMPMDNAPTHNSGSASMVHSHSHFPFYVHIASVAEILEKLAIKKLDLMLLDVEGFELEVMKGISDALKPSILIVEVNPLVLEPLGIQQQCLYDRLSSMGYSCWSLRGRALKPNDITPEQNVIAVLNGTEHPNWVTI